MASSNDPFQGLNIPVSPPPLGIHPNFSDPPSQSIVLVLTSIISLALMLFLFTIRIYTKIRIIGKFGWDDWFCIFGVLGSITYVIGCLMTIKNGVGLHSWDIYISRFTNRFFVSSYVVEIVITPVQLAIKLSLLLFYLQLFHPDSKLRYLIYFGIVFVSLFHISSLVAQLALCTPRHGQSWLDATQSSRYAKTIIAGVVGAAINAPSDLYILCVPLCGVWQLQLPLRKKIGVSVIFSWGFLGCVSSILRLVYYLKLNRDGDVTWDLVPVFALTIAEANVGIMCACMPLLAKFFHHHPALPHSIHRFFSAALKPFAYVTSLLTRRTSSRRSEGSVELVDSSPSRGSRKGDLLTLGTSFKRAQRFGLGLYTTTESSYVEELKSVVTASQAKSEVAQDI